MTVEQHRPRIRLRFTALYAVTLLVVLLGGLIGLVATAVVTKPVRYSPMVRGEAKTLRKLRDQTSSKKAIVTPCITLARKSHSRTAPMNTPPACAQKVAQRVQDRVRALDAGPQALAVSQAILDRAGHRPPGPATLRRPGRDPVLRKSTRPSSMTPSSRRV